MSLDDLIAKLEKHSVPEPNSGCWLWTASVSTARSIRYGTLNIDGIATRAHRAMYAAAVGPIPTGVFVCHKCDTGLCINPDHLFLGTAAENNADRRAKKRDHWFRNPSQARPALDRARRIAHAKPPLLGTQTNSVKLTEAQVREIRALRAGGLTQREIAQRYGMAQPTISALLNGRNWSHVQ